MKIRLFSNYENSTNLMNRFKLNYPIHDEELLIVDDESYNVAVVFNKTSDTIKKSAPIVTFIQEPSWSPCHLDNDFLLRSKHIFVHDKKLFEEHLGIKIGGKVYEEPSFMWFHDNGLKFSDFDEITTEKIKPMSMIVSNIDSPIGNYQKRLSLVEKILDSDLEIDIFGYNLPFKDERYKGGIEFKRDGLAEYKYSIAIENSCERNYITEKFIDCLINESQPVYYGAPNIGSIYSSEGYTNLDLDGPDVINQLRELIKTEPNLSGVKTNKSIYFTYYNLYRRLKMLLLY